MHYYLCGPFFVKECNEFFDKFIERCKETSMANYDTVHKDNYGINSNLNSINAVTSALISQTWDEKDNVEPKNLSQDVVFVPGHYKVDFNKIKSEYDIVSFRRVLRQVLDLDLENLKEGLVVYPHGYDLGTMFELGYFLSRFFGDGSIQMYKNMRKYLIIDKPDDKLIECIEYFISKNFFDTVLNNFEYNSNTDVLLISEGSSIMNIHKFNCVALNVDCYKDTPFNSILAGILYGTGIPFFTYSTTGADSNVMMIASSMFHVKLDPNKDVQDQLRGEVMNDMSKYYWDDTYFDKFKDIK